MKIEQIVQLHGEKGEKSPFRKKDRKKACAKKWDPYNAHPLTRQMGITSHKQPGRLQRKILKNGLTLKEESGIYPTS
ncbi:hypothetical protein AAER89_26820, partial [Klebsiella pneumoniae]|uniref:hypothetical protein n=1 Tax=Klebsiella pneumoniae TaxID=573 RepID=UPI0031370512